MMSEPGSGQTTSSLDALSTSCPVTDVPVVADETTIRTRHIVSGAFTITTNSELKLETDTLATGTGCFFADTIAWLLRCDTGTCETGTIVAVNDDLPGGGWGPSRAVAANAAPGTYRWTVTAYSYNTCGSGNVKLSIDGQQTVVLTAVHFGSLVSRRIIAAGDHLLVGKNPVGPSMTADPEYHDSVLYAFGSSSLDCSTGACGPFRHNDDLILSALPDTIIRLSRVDVPTGWPDTDTSFVAVGIYDKTILPAAPKTMQARLLHVRKHTTQGGLWPCVEQIDNDGDGLTWEIEQLVRSCDKSDDFPAGLGAGEGIGIERWGCSQFGIHLNQYLNVEIVGSGPCGVGGNDADWRCWQLIDSDNDGLRDDQEVFAAAFQCNSIPVGPYFHNPACTALHLWAPKVCPSGSFCATEALSARGDPTPSQHDIILMTDPFTCSAAGCAQWHAPTPHSISTQQSGWLEDIWHDEPLTCWNGLPPTPPATTCANNAANDLPWRVKFHTRTPSPANIYGMADDSMGDEVRRFDRNPWFVTRFKGTGKLGGLFNYAILGHYAGGEVIPSSGSVGRWGGLGNSGQTVWEANGVVAHETGHMRGLGHPHALNDVCEPACASSRTCKTGKCAVNGQLFGCDELTECSQANKVNVNVPTVMSYHYSAKLGMRAKNAAPPTAATPEMEGCAYENLRFSKGLNDILYEEFLDETLPADWMSRKLANELWCFGNGNNNYCSNGGSPFGFLTAQGPWCDVSQCHFNWNRSPDDVADASVAQIDVSNGRYASPGSLTCAEDRLSDVDEWRRMVSIGKQSLAQAPWYHDLPIFIGAFNGAAHTNYVPWESLLPVTSAGGFSDSDTYPVNACVHGDVGCKTDVCVGDPDCTTAVCPAVPNTCRMGQGCHVASGACECTASAHCFSGTCMNNRCAKTIGAKTCANDADCLDGFACLQGACGIWRLSNKDPQSWPSGGAPRDVKAFGGPGSGSFLRLQNVGTTSPLTTIGGDHQSYWLRFDLRWDGNAPGQTVHVLAASGAYVVQLVSGPAGGSVVAQTAGSSIAYPSHTTGRPLEPGRWYRVRVGFGGTPSKLIVQVTAWDRDRGWYDVSSLPLPDTGCVEKLAPGTVAPHGDGWFGYDGSNDMQRLFGRLDNVHLYNYIPGGEALPAACEVVP